MDVAGDGNCNPGDLGVEHCRIDYGLCGIQIVVPDGIFQTVGQKYYLVLKAPVQFLIDTSLIDVVKNQAANQSGEQHAGTGCKQDDRSQVLSPHQFVQMHDDGNFLVQKTLACLITRHVSVSMHDTAPPVWPGRRQACHGFSKD